MQKLPVINIAYKEKCFPVFTDVHGSVNLPDSGGKAELVDGTNVQLKPLHRKVPLTWKNSRVTNSKRATSTAELMESPQQTQLHRAVIWVLCCVLCQEIQPRHAEKP